MAAECWHCSKPTKPKPPNVLICQSCADALYERLYTAEARVSNLLEELGKLERARTVAKAAN